LLTNQIAPGEKPLTNKKKDLKNLFQLVKKIVISELVVGSSELYRALLYDFNLLLVVENYSP
jgi:hypothetical protein